MKLNLINREKSDISNSTFNIYHFHTTYILPSLHPGNSPHADPVGKFHCKQKGSGQGVAD